MNDLKGTSEFAIRPETCPVQVQSFLRTSAEYFGMTLDAEGGCLAATQEMPLTGYRNHFVSSQLSGSEL